MANATYVIRLENATKQNNSPIANGSSNDDNADPKRGKKDANGVLKALVAVDRYAEPFINAAIQQHVSTIELRTGASEHQQRVEQTLGLAKQAVGISTTLITGFATMNPLLIVGGLVSAATAVINYNNKAKKLQMAQNLENISLRGMNVRAGGYAPSYSASRMGR